MSVKIRLTRTGARNAAAFRVVAADSRSPRDGRFLEILGWYDPKLENANFDVKLDRVEYWKGQGAEVSDTVKSLVKRKTAVADAVIEQPVVEEAPAAVETEVSAEVSEDALEAAPTEGAAEAMEDEVKAGADA